MLNTILTVIFFVGLAGLGWQLRRSMGRELLP
jgi:uncharacterized membrane protein YqjE